jgi:hypothetical protein
MRTLYILYPFPLLVCVGQTYAFNIAADLLEMESNKLEQSIAEFHTNLLVEHVQVALEILEVRICSSFYSPKLTRVVQ